MKYKFKDENLDKYMNKWMKAEKGSLEEDNAETMVLMRVNMLLMFDKMPLMECVKLDWVCARKYGVNPIVFVYYFIKNVTIGFLQGIKERLEI